VNTLSRNVSTDIGTSEPFETHLHPQLNTIAQVNTLKTAPDSFEFDRRPRVPARKPHCILPRSPPGVYATTSEPFETHLHPQLNTIAQVNTLKTADGRMVAYPGLHLSYCVQLRMKVSFEGF
jgi:hypothetical protein